MRSHHFTVALTLLAASACVFAPSFARAAKWQITRTNHLVLTPPEGVTVNQMSGVSYLGVVEGAHRFIAVQQTRGELVAFDVAFSANGAITGVANVAAVSINSLEPLEDYEGVAFTNPARNSVFLSDEDSLGVGDRVGVREVSLATGAELQAVTIPAVFANRRPNRGFESLTRSPDGTTMWTANEQALTVDGDLSTASAGTDVRLLKLNVAGDAVTAGPQYVYHVSPIHGSSPIGSPQSGLSDLVAMPDGTLLTLERSVAFLASPSTYKSSVFEVDFTNATDVSVGAAASGLIGQTFTRVGKSELWSGPADGTNGQNLEGLALGPRLTNGAWVLLGVVDDGWNPTTNSDGDPLSNNTLVAFTATPIPSADFNMDGAVDGSDLLQWQRGLGKSIGAAQSEGDADRDGDVDGDDLSHWQSTFGTLNEIVATPVPEPASLASFGLALLSIGANRRRRRQQQPREKSQPQILPAER